MSVFDKLKAYSRKPAAVILATVMATSTIPTTPIAQAVTAAYAESTTQTTKETEATETKVTPADLGIKETPWDGKSNITLTFSTHIDNGEAVATISADQVKALVKDQLENSEDFKNQFVYTKSGQDVLSKQIDAKLAEINKDVLPKKNVTSEDGTEKTEYSNAVYKEDSMTREITACKVQLTNNTEGANSAATVNDDGSITIKSNGVISGTVNLKVTQLSVKVGFGYKYTKTVTKTTSSSSSSDGSTSNNNGGISIEVGTEDGNTTTTNKVPSNTTVTPTVVDNDADAKADVTLKDVTSGYGVGSTISTASVTTEEYYAGIDSSTFADVNAEGLVYKTAHDDYVVFNGKDDKWVGLKGEIASDKANDELFDVKPTSTSLDKTKTVQITPKKAFEGERTFTINWKYPNGKGAGTTTVHVKGIAKKPIEADQLEVNYQFYRFQDDQEKNVCDLLNQKVKDQLVDDADKAAVKKEDYFKSVSLDGYDETGANASVCKIVPGEENDKNDVYSNYEINCPTSVYIVPIESVNLEHWGDTTESGEKTAELTLTSKYGEDNHEWTITHKNFDDRYVKELPVASWDGHMLSKDLVKDSFTNTWKNDKDEEGSPAYPLYARNSKNGIITRVTVSYKYDRTAPTLKNITFDNDASVKKVPKDDILFTDQKSDVSYTLGDVLSGVDHDSVKTTYDDLKSGKSGIPADLKWGKTGDKASFDIKGDTEVPVNSISIHAVDMAGNVATLDRSDSQEVPEKVSKLVSNSSGVTVNVSYSDTTPQRTANGKGYYNHGRSVTFTVTDPFFKYTKQYEPQQICKITRDGSDYVTVSLDQQGSGWKDLGNDTYSYTVDLSADGDYVIGEAKFHDVLGGGIHSASADGEEFVIDQTAPKLNVSWNTEAAQNGKYYNAARTATITVEEHNFDPNLFKIEAPVSAGNGDEATPAQIGGWSSNGDTHTATVTFPGQGVYTLSVSGEDLASNKSESYTSPEFVIDTIKPKIDIQNVVNRTAYAGEVAPTAAVHDTNLADGTSIEVSKISYPLSKDDPNPYAGAAINTSATDKSVSYLNPAKTKGNDGVYTLTVQAIDLAGNTESEAVTWSVNRFGSTYVISDNTGKMLDQYLKSSKTTDVKVTEINPSGLDDNKTSVELTRDTKNTTLKSGDNYTTDANTASGWSEYNYTVSKSNYDKDGAYRVLFHSEDAAGNSSENTMEGKNAKKSGAAAEINFAVDDTAPIASFVDLASNGKYEESSHKAKVSFEDNLKLSKAQIKVNGKTVATFTADQLEKSPIREFTLDGSSSKQDVTVVAWDAAGNKSKELKATGVLVTNDSFVLWMNNLPLMVGTIVAIVVVAGGIYMVVAKKRKENEEK